MEFLVLEIFRLNIGSQDSDSDDDVSALCGSDSDILESVENADFLWTTIAQRSLVITFVENITDLNFKITKAENLFHFTLCNIVSYLLAVYLILLFHDF